MTPIRWDPFKNLVTLQERMNRLFDESMQRGRETEPFGGGSWAPPVDIYETDGEVVLVAELPGMDEKDIDIEVKENVLTLKGERRMEKSVKEEGYHRVERAYGPFSRAFTLPQSIQHDKISAGYTKGVLEIRMPKSVKAKAHQIKIETKEPGGEQKK